MIMGPVSAQRWCYACAKQLVERLIYAHGTENNLKFTIIRPYNWIGPHMDYIPVRMPFVCVLKQKFPVALILTSLVGTSEPLSLSR